MAAPGPAPALYSTRTAGGDEGRGGEEQALLGQEEAGGGGERRAGVREGKPGVAVRNRLVGQQVDRNV